MTIHRPLGLLLASALASSAAAQSASQPLNLKLPPGAVPAASSSAARPASASTAPGVYYGDTSGTTDASLAANAPADTCDDATYNQPQVHGSVGMGVVAGNHLSGNYQTGTVRVTKAFGDCNHPTGGMSFTISGGQGHFNDHRFGH